ncbi:MAG: hypothetical protein EA421_06530 [Gemmatimonadales bacterium]|nr:MAG: hypothetical protein EA421_06530 [Gemmatimonadales bacterium]
MVNGREGLREWGQGALADPTLLYVRGFDAGTRAFRYEVNEAFGQDRWGVNVHRSPFTVRISARVALGGNPAQTNRALGETEGLGIAWNAPGGEPEAPRAGLTSGGLPLRDGKARLNRPLHPCPHRSLRRRRP